MTRVANHNIEGAKKVECLDTFNGVLIRATFANGDIETWMFPGNPILNVSSLKPKEQAHKKN